MGRTRMYICYYERERECAHINEREKESVCVWVRQNVYVWVRQRGRKKACVMVDR